MPEVSHEFRIFMYLKPCLELNNSQLSEVKVFEIILFEKVMDNLHCANDLVEVRVELLTGLNKVVDHREEVMLEGFEAFNFVLVGVEDVCKDLVDGMVLREGLDILWGVGVDTHETKIAFTVSED